MRRKTGLLAAALAATMLGTSGGAFAVVFTVTNSADMPDLAPGDGVCNAGAPFGCTLRAGVQEANALPGGDTIILDGATYNLTRVGAGEDFADKGDLDIRDHLGIIGIGPGTIIDGQLADRIFDVHAVLPVPVLFTVGDMTIRRGYSGPNDGGAIRNAGHLTTVQLVVSSSISELRGGGIAGIGAASFDIKTTGITGNRAGSADCSVPGRGGGGLFVASTARPHVVVTETYVTNNISCTHGGGIMSENAIRLFDVSVRTNSASSSSGRGGGIHANVIEMEQVGLDSNRSWEGGGLWFRGEARILNSTISSNAAVTGGGGIASYGWLNLRHVTMANNNSGDPLNPSGGLVHKGGYRGFPLPVIVSSILSANTLANCRILDAGGATIPLSSSPSQRNVDTDNTCGFSTVGPNPSIVLVPALLAPLASNGGTGRSHLLLAGSPARDTAVLGTSCPPRDQRYFVRPIGAGCDIGSTEQ